MESYTTVSKNLEGELNTLVDMISERLNNFGIYYRIFSRVKKMDSIKSKLSSKEYAEDTAKKLQDLLGIRIVLYYQDDIKVCKKLFEEFFEPVIAKDDEDSSNHIVWKQYESKENTFDAMKINGVFRLPGFIREHVENYIDGLRIAPTFEIQLRTILFEGWHEIEHDLRYKNIEQWDTFPKESRKLNSILASLEMCDQYMLNLLNDMGHNFYKRENWDLMIRYKFRLQIENCKLDERIAGAMSLELAKRVFKSQKEKLVERTLKAGINRLDSNVIVYIVNESLKDTDEYNGEISDLFWKVYRGMVPVKRKKGNICRLKRSSVFDTSVWLDTKLDTGDDIKGNTCEDAFVKTIESLYQWQKDKLAEFYPEEFASEAHSYHIHDDGLDTFLEFDRETLSASAKLAHISHEEPGTVWEVWLAVSRVGDRLLFQCKNTLISPEDVPNAVIPYSRPGVYLRIAEKVGLYDGRTLCNGITEITENNIEEVKKLILNERRKYPVLVISYPNESDSIKRDSVYGQLVRYSPSQYGKPEKIINALAYVCHMYKVTGKCAQEFATKLGEDAVAFSNGIRIFGKGFSLSNRDTYITYKEHEIINQPKDIYSVDTAYEHRYLSLEGAEAMHREIIKRVYNFLV